MGIIAGLILGLGLLLIWMSLWEAPDTAKKASWLIGFEEDLLVAGLRGISTTTFFAAVALFAALVAALTFVITGLTVGAALAGLAASVAPSSSSSPAQNDNASAAEKCGQTS